MSAFPCPHFETLMMDLNRALADNEFAMETVLVECKVCLVRVPLTIRGGLPKSQLEKVLTERRSEAETERIIKARRDYERCA